MTAMTYATRVWQLLDSSAIGGIETHVVALTAGLRAAGVDARAVLLADHGPHPMEALLEAQGCPLSKLDGSLRTLLEALKRDRPAVLHTHGYKAGILGRMAGRLAGVRTVSTFHNGDAGLGRIRLYTGLDRLTSLLGRRVAVNEEIADRLPGPVTVVENGVPLPAPYVPTTGTRIGFVGRLSPEKGPDTFLDLAGALPDQTFDVFGDGPMRSALTETSENLHFHGAVPSMVPHWPQLGLLVMPSRAEGLPMAALEAMARGIPVAAFDVGALKKLTAERRGWCAPAGDVSGLVSMIREWVAESPDERLARSARNRQFVADHYSVERMVSDLLSVFQDALT